MIYKGNEQGKSINWFPFLLHSIPLLTTVLQGHAQRKSNNNIMVYNIKGNQKGIKTCIWFIFQLYYNTYINMPQYY